MPIFCPECGHKNLEGAMICAQCSSSLTDLPSALDTKSFDDEHDGISIRQSAGTATLNSRGEVRIEIEGREHIVVHPQPKIIFGRQDPLTGFMPGIDMTPFDGHLKGISREHAGLLVKDNNLHLFDLDSRNGTYLNGDRLVANRLYLLHNGDEVALGRIMMRVYLA